MSDVHVRRADSLLDALRRIRSAESLELAVRWARLAVVEDEAMQLRSDYESEGKQWR